MYWCQSIDFITVLTNNSVQICLGTSNQPCQQRDMLAGCQEDGDSVLNLKARKRPTGQRLMQADMVSSEIARGLSLWWFWFWLAFSNIFQTSFVESNPSSGADRSWGLPLRRFRLHGARANLVSRVAQLRKKYQKSFRSRNLIKLLVQWQWHDWNLILFAWALPEKHMTPISDHLLASPFLFVL